MDIVLEHPTARVIISSVAGGRQRVVVEPVDPALNDLYRLSCETSYPAELIEIILRTKGPLWLCDEILREEDPLYNRATLEKVIFAYFPEAYFENRRLLDFGCGCGASTMLLAKMLPKTRIVGLDIDPNSLAVARSRLVVYGFSNVEFLWSPDPARIPNEIGRFDYVCLHAVYEHLLPHEREPILHQLWSRIHPGGVLFISATPHRYWILEGHTTRMPLINFLPDAIAFRLVKKYSPRCKGVASWQELLRQGIRGATDREILQILSLSSSSVPIVLRPSRLGLRDRIDIWYELSLRKTGIKRGLKLGFKLIQAMTGITFVPNVNLAIQKFNFVIA